MSTNDIPMTQPSAGARRPDAAAQVKKDRRRKEIIDRLRALDEQFGREKDLKYRDHLARVQVDQALVMRMEPYAKDALTMLQSLRDDQAKTHSTQTHNTSGRTLIDMAGPRFTEWSQSITDIHEYRDFQLTKQLHDYKTRIQSCKNTHNYRVETAKRERGALAKTLRDRLINTLNAKKHRLLKEKEAFEIGDTSALMLHSNQYSFLRPTSPGGNPKRTRGRRDADDLLVPNGTSHDKKRKRGGDDDGSPIPLKRALDTAEATPMWQSEKLRLSAKQAGPMYNIEKLFTEKELSMTYNTSALAAHRYVLRHRVGGEATNGSQSDEEEEAPAMERQVSHQTRSTRGANVNFSDDKIIGWDAIASFETPANLDLAYGAEMPKLPTQQPLQYLKSNMRSADSNFPTGLNNDDVNSDLAVMKLFKTFDKQHQPGASMLSTGGLRKLLEEAAHPILEEKYVAFSTHAKEVDYEGIRRDMGIPDESPSKGSPSKHTTKDSSKDSAAQRRLKDTLTKGVSMSRQNSSNGVGMSRQGSSRGKGRKN